MIVYKPHSTHQKAEHSSIEQVQSTTDADDPPVARHCQPVGRNAGEFALHVIPDGVQTILLKLQPQSYHETAF